MTCQAIVILECLFLERSIYKQKVTSEPQSSPKYGLIQIHKKIM